MTDGNLAALHARLASIDAWEARHEPCQICDETGCDCAEEAANDKGDHEMQMMKEDGL